MAGDIPFITSTRDHDEYKCSSFIMMNISDLPEPVLSPKFYISYIYIYTKKGISKQLNFSWQPKIPQILIAHQILSIPFAEYIALVSDFFYVQFYYLSLRHHLLPGTSTLNVLNFHNNFKKVELF